MPLFTVNPLRQLVFATLCAASAASFAQGYEPVIESFRLDASDQLIIDRGGPVDRAGDVNGDNLEDLLIGAGVGAVRAVFGPTRGNDGILNGQQLDGVSGFVILNDSENDSLLAGLGDINGDGVDDIGVASITGTRVVFGSANGFNRSLDVAALDGSNGFVFDSGATDIKRAGDINADGLADFIVGNANASPNGLTGAGVSYVIFGSNDGFPATLSPASLSGSNGFAILGISAQDRSGRYVSGAGDFNNDGFDDVIIGAPNQTTNGLSEAGAAYLLLGDDEFPPAVSLADIDAGNGLVFQGSQIQALAGAAVAAVGDINHDGIDDLAIGAPGKGPFGIPSDYPGEAFVLFGGSFSDEARISKADLDGTNGFVVRGIRGGVVPIEVEQPIWGDMAGADIDTAGDINGDGIDDMIIGAPHTIINPMRKGVGQVYLVFGSDSAYPATLRLSDLDGDNGFRINGTGTVDYFGVSVASAGDFNDDDLDDVMMSASGQGETYVFYARDTGLVRAATAPEAEQGMPSTGLSASALTLGDEAAPLAFDERADPTGPNPLPPGTPTDPLDPETPGYTAPYPLNTEPPARPAEPGGQPDGQPDTNPDPMPEDPGGGDEPSVDDDSGQGTGGDSGQGTDDESGQAAGSDNGIPTDGLIKTGNSGAVSWWVLLLAAVWLSRRQR